MRPPQSHPGASAAAPCEQSGQYAHRATRAGASEVTCTQGLPGRPRAVLGRTRVSPGRRRGAPRGGARGDPRGGPRYLKKDISGRPSQKPGRGPGSEPGWLWGAPRLIRGAPRGSCRGAHRSAPPGSRGAPCCGPRGEAGSGRAGDQVATREGRRGGAGAHWGGSGAVLGRAPGRLPGRPRESPACDRVLNPNYLFGRPWGTHRVQPGRAPVQFRGAPAPGAPRRLV